MDELNALLLIINIALLIFNSGSYFFLHKYEKKLSRMLNQNKAILDRAEEVRKEAKRINQMFRDELKD